MLIRCKVLFLFIFLIAKFTNGQEHVTEVDNLNNLSSIITSQQPDFKKYEANDKFKKKLEEIFQDKDFYNFPYDSVKSISAITSPDNKFKIITWGFAKENGEFEYFGYLIFPNDKLNDNRFIYLVDNSGKINHPERNIGDFKNWYGAIYYKIIFTRYQGKKYYTLLGWKGNNNLTTKKVIEVLSFRSSGNPVFGAVLFRKYKEKSARIIFEYSAQTTFLLRYEKQMVHVITKPSHSAKSSYTQKDKNDGKAMKADKKVEAKQKTTKTNMILFDRLSPIDPRTSKYAPDLEGQYQFYAPETNILDAFVFKNGKWIFTKDIDARNPDQKKTKKNKPPTDLK